MLKKIIAMVCGANENENASGNASEFYIQCVQSAVVTLQTDSNILYRLNDDENYSQYESGSCIYLDAGDKISFWNTDNELQNSRFLLYEGIVDLGGNINSLINYREVYNYCFMSLFDGCSAIRFSDKLILPSKNLAESCYEFMFSGCYNMQSSPQILAETLAYRCCYKMFFDCYALKFAPCLYATETVSMCYSGMFQGCYELQQIEVRFTEWNSNTSFWVSSVYNENGVFVCPSALEILHDDHHIPPGWQIITI